MAIGSTIKQALLGSLLLFSVASAHDGRLQLRNALRERAELETHIELATRADAGGIQAGVNQIVKASLTANVPGILKGVDMIVAASTGNAANAGAGQAAAARGKKTTRNLSGEGQNVDIEEEDEEEERYVTTQKLIKIRGEFLCYAQLSLTSSRIDINPLFTSTYLPSTPQHVMNTTLLLSLLASAVAAFAAYRFYVAFNLRLRAQQLGCQPATRYKHLDPVFGLDIFLRTGDAIAKNQFLIEHQRRYDTYGRTFEALNFGSRALYSIHPENLRAVFSKNAADWGIEPLRLRNMSPFCGAGFITTDGPDWKVSHDLLKPGFHRSNISDFGPLEEHLSLLLKQIPKDGTKFDLQPFILKLYLDLNALFLFGEPLGMLSGTLPPHAEGFLDAFQDGFKGCGMRIALGPLNFLMPTTAWLKACYRVHKFADVYVDRAIAQRENHNSTAYGEGKNQKRTLLSHMVQQTDHKATLRNQVVQAMMAATETTASLVSHVIRNLASHPDVFTQVRAEVLALGDSPLDFDQLPRIKSLQHAITETLRLYPVFPQNNRVALKAPCYPLAEDQMALHQYTNRDGHVNEVDIAGKAFWSLERGAIFLPNIGDSSRRCSNTDLQGNPLSNHELSSCHDASGHLLLEPSLVAPLRVLPIEVPDNAYAHIYATSDAAYERVRLFVNDFPNSPNETASWRLVDKEFFFNATQLTNGINLGIDGREFVKDTAAWDGKAIIQIDLYTNGKTFSDSVALKVAPVLTHHHLQRVDTIISTAGNESDPAQLLFLSDMVKGRVDAGIETPIYLFNQSGDIWAQDFFEPAYASMPGPDGPISIRIMLRSAQSTRTGGRQVFEQLRGPGIGGFQPEGGRRGFGHLEINSFGNLETIPPYTSKSGIRYPAGRIIQGKHFEKHPAESMSKFLNGQEIQKPLILETGWLLIGHVDEFVQFVPSNVTGLGFTITIADTTSALQILENATKAGHGNIRAISFNNSSEDGGRVSEELATTIDEILANSTFIDVNKYAQKHIDMNLETLLSEIPIAREHVIRVPVLFKTLPGRGLFRVSSDGLPSHTDQVMENEFLVVAFSPAAINGVVLGHHYLSPKTWGPVVNGVDLFAKGVRDAYAKAGMSVSFVDDYLSHHVGLGEIHCGSNTLRETTVSWWA
ncbi:Cytochrome P450 monooxygenase lepH [Paramyrothecium foliicola]|nr:Cytochrome P450 monooxygenase lepH [Paramyrothecium foliicola]